MKIYDNGVTRDATTEEIAAYTALMAEGQEAEQQIALTADKKLELLLASIPTEATPTVAPKVGYKWAPVYSAAAGYAWEMVEDPNALGTVSNPLYWLPGKAVMMGYHYTDGSNIYVALADGVPSGWDDSLYFAAI